MFQINKRKQHVKNKTPSLGVWLSLANPALAEILGRVGYDFAIIDNEHELSEPNVSYKLNRDNLWDFVV
jgi:2-keto-3-deoxy-L-rhamnonate aldolase RhmA